MGDLTIFIIWLLIIALFLRVDFIFYIVYVVAGVYTWSRWFVPFVMRQVSLERKFNDHVFLGEKVPITLELTNRSRLPVPWLQMRDSVPVLLQTSGVPRYAFTLPGRSTARFTHLVQAARRGYYQIGPLLLQSGDFFGFSEQSFNFPPAYLTVYPRIIPLARLGLPARLPFGAIPSRQRLFADPARPVGVRDYRPGDPLRQINWKVSAHASGRANDLMVKTLEPAISLDTAVLLDLDRNAYNRREVHDQSEWAIQVASSLAAHLMERRQAVGLITNGLDPLLQTRPGGPAFDKESGRLLSSGPGSSAVLPTPLPPRTGRAYLMKILSLLARIELNEGVPLATWAPAACAHLSWGVTILAITPQGDEATCNMLHRLLRAGYNPILLVVAPTADFGHVRQRARQLGFVAYPVTGQAELARVGRTAP